MVYDHIPITCIWKRRGGGNNCCFPPPLQEALHAGGGRQGVSPTWGPPPHPPPAPPPDLIILIIYLSNCYCVHTYYPTNQIVLIAGGGPLPSVCSLFTFVWFNMIIWFKTVCGGNLDILSAWRQEIYRRHCTKCRGESVHIGDINLCGKWWAIYCFVESRGNVLCIYTVTRCYQLIHMYIY